MYLDFSAFQDDAIVNAKTPEEALKQICRENQVICDGYDLLLYGTNDVTLKGRFYCTLDILE